MTEKQNSRSNQTDAPGAGDSEDQPESPRGDVVIPRETHHESPFPIAGIGASAGGLAALKQFLSHVPEDSGLAWVVVVHLSPDHESHLAELLQPHVHMPVQQVTETTRLAANHVYIIPPNANLNTIDTHLRLSELEELRRERAPIDHFFRTLAKTHDGQSIGVVLTGTGSDGTLGLREIREQGGFTIAQDPNEAEYDGMPRSAVAMGLVDLVLPLVEIPEAILRFTRTRPRVPLELEGEELEQQTQQLLQKIFAQLRARTGRDFSSYKRSTIMRRIQRRLQLHQMEELPAYLDLLRSREEEARALADDLLVTVTNFFRDPDVFESLEQHIVPQLFEGKGPDDDLRVWSVGCATGEEVYSLAILLLEHSARLETPPRLQIFASDLHRQSLEKAREGFYPGDIETDVGTERLRRFFRPENGGYRILKEIRELVVFAPHNLLGDPPFSRIDLISCRNMLIYLQRNVQKEVIELFHYALNPSGFLLLGTSESLEASELFHAHDKKLCIFRRRNVPGPEPRLPVFPLTNTRQYSGNRDATQVSEHVAYGPLHHRLVEQIAPPSVLVTPDDKVVHLSEHAGRYLIHPGGQPTVNLLKLVRPELRFELQTSLMTARERKQPVRSRPIPVRFDTESSLVVFNVRPALEPEQQGYVLVFFEEFSIEDSPADQRPASDLADAPSASPEENGRISELQAELGQMRERLQAILEEDETSREELKASNEELQSANEELRSTMEELETSKEELQSMNEELQTVNQENRHKVEELAQLSGDLQNLMAATEIATLFLDRELRIIRFTPQVSELFNVRHIDRGRPLTDLTHRLGYPDLQEDAQRVLRRLTPVIREIRSDSGHWYLTRILPYRSTQDRIEGVVITLMDLTERKQAEEELRRSEARLRRVLDIDQVGVLYFSQTGRLVDTNEAFLKVTGYTRADVKSGTLTWNSLTPPEYHEECRKQLEHLRKTGRMGPYEKEYFCKDGSRTWMMFTGAEIDENLIVKHCIDISDRKRSEKALLDSEERYRTLFESIDEGFCIIEVLFDEHGQANDYYFLTVNPAFETHTGISQAAGRRMREIAPAHEDYWYDSYGRVALTGERIRFQNRAESLGRHFEVYAFRIGTPEQHRVAVLFSDVTDRKLAEEALQLADRHKDEFLAMLGHELRNPLAGIVSGTQAMGMHDLPEEIAEIQQVISRQASHMTCLVDELLDVSRIARGRLTIRMEPIELRSLLRETVEDYRRGLTHDDCRFNCQLPEEEVWVNGDRTRLSQAITNVLHNAVKFSDGPCEVTVELTVAAEQAEDSSDSSHQASILVTDQGIGMTQETLAHIFYPFAQADNSIDRSRGGLGLGLALVQGLMELHGGQVQAASPGPGKGSTITMTLPVVQPLAADTPEPDPVLAPPHEVLLIDDRRDAVLPVRRLLELDGHTVHVATSGPDGIALARRVVPEVILCDIGLDTEMSGYDVARELRAENQFRQTYMVALTGYGREEDLREAQKAGFNWHLTKPAGIDSLRELLSQKPQFSR